MRRSIISVASALAVTASISSAHAGTITTPGLFVEPGGSMTCVVVNAGSKPIEVVSMTLSGEDGSPSGGPGFGCALPQTLIPNQICTRGFGPSGAAISVPLTCQVVVNGSNKKVRVSMVVRDSNGTAAVQGQ